MSEALITQADIDAVDVSLDGGDRAGRSFSGVTSLWDFRLRRLAVSGGP